MGGLSELKEIDTRNESCCLSCDKRASYVLCLQLLLTVWAGRLTTNLLPLPNIVIRRIPFARVTHL